MKKRIAKALRNLADKISPEKKKQGPKPFLLADNYTCSTIAVARGVDREKYERIKIHFLNKNGGNPVPIKEVEQFFIEQEKEWIQESIFLGIKEHNVIEYQFDKDNFFVIGKLPIYIKQ